MISRNQQTNISWTFASSKPPKRKAKDLHNASKPWLQPCSSLAHHVSSAANSVTALAAIFGWLENPQLFSRKQRFGAASNIVFCISGYTQVEIECFHLKGNNTWPGGKHLCSWIDMEKNIFGLLAFKKQAWSSMDCQKVAERGTGFQWQTTSSFHK